MAFRWILHDESGTDLRASDYFSSQAEAETWMGSDWASLLEEGAESVTLMDDDVMVYRMGLREG